MKSRFPEAVFIALIAIATPRVQEVIFKNLNLKESQKFLASFNKRNLYIQVVRKFNTLEQTLDF